MANGNDDGEQGQRGRGVAEQKRLNGNGEEIDSNEGYYIGD